MRRSRRLAIGAVAFVVVVTGAALAARSIAWETPSPVAAGAAAPRFAAVTLDSVPLARSLDDYRGHPVLLNVWATWCGPCREEMPSMQRLYDTFRDRGLRVVAVSIDDAGSEGLIREFVAEHKLTFDVLHDPKAAIMSQYLVRGVPETFLISRSGEIRLTRFVADWSTAESRAMVERLLLDDVRPR